MEIVDLTPYHPPPVTSQLSLCHVLLTWQERGTRLARSATDAKENEESIMNNWYTIETEAEFRRREWQRAVEAEARAAQARPANGRTRWPRLGRLTLANLRSLVLPRPSFTARLEPDCRTVVC
jgi:hypothetical protein